jgi:hypothetical protein
MPEVRYVTVTEDYYEDAIDGTGPRLIHAAGAKIQARAARAYGDAIKVREEAEGGAAPALPFDATPDAPAAPRKVRG